MAGRVPSQLAHTTLSPFVLFTVSKRSISGHTWRTSDSLPRLIRPQSLGAFAPGAHLLPVTRATGRRVTSRVCPDFRFRVTSTCLWRWRTGSPCASRAENRDRGGLDWPAPWPALALPSCICLHPCHTRLVPRGALLRLGLRWREAKPVEPDPGHTGGGTGTVCAKARRAANPRSHSPAVIISDSPELCSRGPRR